MDLTFIHARLSATIIAFSLIAAVWGLVQYARGRRVDGSYWGIAAAAELLYIVQGLIGVTLWIGGAAPARGIHILYGAVSVVALPAYYAFSEGRDDRAALLAYSLLFLFLAGIGLRAASTAV